MGTKREEFEALQQEMAVEQKAAILGLHDWFQSDAGKAFAEKFIGTQQDTIPNSHYDQILSGCLSTVANVEAMCRAMYEAENPPEAPELEAAEPATEE